MFKKNQAEIDAAIEREFEIWDEKMKIEDPEWYYDQLNLKNEKLKEQERIDNLAVENQQLKDALVKKIIEVPTTEDIPQPSELLINKLDAIKTSTDFIKGIYMQAKEKSVQKSKNKSKSREQSSYDNKQKLLKLPQNKG